MSRVEGPMQYPFIENTQWISMCLCYIHEPWMSIRVFLDEWIFRHEYYHGHCMDTSTRGPGVHIDIH